MTEIIGPANRDKLLLMTQQMFAAILSPVIKAGLANKHDSMQDSSLHTAATIEEQIDLFLDHYFYQYEAN
ncbi:hypothetical protein SAMN02799624_01620 [Paenibacillus sp. UNC496MF]|uniref:hypothetical protein n=1 Tax=Paenibacillus sp. UNC496MF TaxID=1502753 RepID=UPI0008EBD7EF|nr:hypothetical protein [Paenibacillus sp. UNC496MF]SFI60965.1 hypothetical protein SAMN02799624_01620 [Paenibacillus sp. UNC496MF]